MKHTQTSSEFKRLWTILEKSEKQAEKRQKEYEAQQKEYKAQQKKEDEKRQKNYEARQKEYEAQQKKEDEKRQKDYEARQKELKAWQKENKAWQKESRKRMKYLDDLFIGQWGKLIEALIDGDLIKLLNQRNIQVTHTLTQLKKDYGIQQFEFDIVAVNKTEVVVVEVKTTLKTKDVSYFLEKLNKFKNYCPEYKDKKVYGAMAYLKTQDNIRKNAQRNGLFVIRAVGNSSSIVNDKNFKPKTF